MRPMNLSSLVCSLFAVAPVVVLAQTPPQRNPDVSNKALITKSTPGISNDAFKNQSANATDTLRKMANDYYAWRNENYPVRSTQDGERLLRLAERELSSPQ